MRFTLSTCYNFLFCSSWQLPYFPLFKLTESIIKLSLIISKSVLISAVSSVPDTIPLQFLTSNFRRDKWTRNASLCIVTQNQSNAFVKRKTKGWKQKLRNVLLLYNIIWINRESSANTNTNTKQAGLAIVS